MLHVDNRLRGPYLRLRGLHLLLGPVGLSLDQVRLSHGENSLLLRGGFRQRCLPSCLGDLRPCRLSLQMSGLCLGSSEPYAANAGHKGEN